jgi:hypothetical protein
MTTMRKTIKNTTGNGGGVVAAGLDVPTTDNLLDNTMGSNTDSANLSSIHNLDEIPAGIAQLQNETRDRDQRINQLLETMTTLDADNDGANLANFQPPPKPELSQKKSGSNYGPGVGVGSQADSPIDFQQNDYQVPPPQNVLQRQRGGVGGSGYTSVDFDRQTAEYSNYNHVYDPRRVIHKPHYAPPIAGGNVSVGINDELMKKVNYMIHMLEQQEVEKTANITEEFILYTFLGVFIIYIVDSFSRSGRYIR